MTDTLTRADLAERWQTTPPTISRWAQSGRIPAPMDDSPKRRGRHWARDEIEAFEESGCGMFCDHPDELIDGVMADLRIVASDESVVAELRGAAEAAAEFLANERVPNLMKAALLPSLLTTNWHAAEVSPARQLKLLRARMGLKSLIRKANKGNE